MKTRITIVVAGLASVSLVLGLGLGNDVSLPSSESGDDFYLPPNKDYSAVPALAWELRPTATADLPATLPVYDLGGDKRTASHAAELANRFGIAEPRVDHDPGANAYYVEGEDTSYDLKVHEREGGLIFGNPTMFDTVTDGEQPELPSPEEGRTWAISFLIEKGVLPSTTSIDLEKPSYYWNKQIHVDRTNDTREVYRTNLQVRFNRTVGEYPATGPGAKMYVHFSDGPQLAGVTKSWPPLESPNSRFLRSMESMKGALEDGEEGVRIDASPTCSQAEIVGAHLEYYVPGRDSERDSAFPVIVFTGPCRDASGEPLGPESFRAEVPAVG